MTVANQLGQKLLQGSPSLPGQHPLLLNPLKKAMARGGGADPLVILSLHLLPPRPLAILFCARSVLSAPGSSGPSPRISFSTFS